MMKDNKKEIQEELKHLAPLLSKLKKEDTFEIPENYFKEMPDQILSQLDFPEHNASAENIIVSSKENWLDRLVERWGVIFQPKVAIGFGIATVLMVGVLFFTQNKISEGNGLASLSDEELENYIKANIDEFEEEVLYSFLENEDLSGFGELGIDEEDLDNYLDGIVDEFEDEDL